MKEESIHRTDSGDAGAGRAPTRVCQLGVWHQVNPEFPSRLWCGEYNYSLGAPSESRVQGSRRGKVCRICSKVAHAQSAVGREVRRRQQRRGRPLNSEEVRIAAGAMGVKLPLSSKLGKRSYPSSSMRTVSGGSPTLGKRR